MGTPTTNNAEQQALQAIQAQYQQALAFVEAMEKDTARINYDQGWIAEFESMGKAFRGMEAPYKADEAAAEADLKNQEEALKALDPSFSSLCDTLDSLISCIDSAATDKNAGMSNVVGDIQNLQSVMDKIFSAMKQKLQGDMYSAELSSSVSDQLTASELADIAADGIQYQSSELSTLNGAMDSLSALITSYHTAYNSADADSNKYNFWDDAASFFGLGDAGKKKAEDKAAMANATDMMKGLSSVMGSLSSEVAGLMPQFTQVINVIKALVKQVQEILSDTTMNIKEKQGAVLALVMFLLTFFQVIKQQVETEKAKNNQDMSKGAVQASQINIDNTMTEQKIRMEQERNAKIMKITMMVAQAVLGGVMMAMAPGIGTALLVGIVTAFEEMQSAGVLDITQKLADAIGSKIGANILIGLGEMGITVGGGALLDQVVSKALEAAVQKAAAAAVQSANGWIEKGVQTALTATGAVGDPAASAAVENVLTQLAKSAAQKAAQGAATQFMKQPFGVLLEMAAKKTFSQALKQALETASEQAVETAVENGATIAKLAARGIQSTNAVVDDIATLAANRSVASISRKTIEKVAEDADRTQLKTAASRALYTNMFSMANTGMMTDMLKKMGVTDDTVMEIFGAIQQLIQMVALMAGSGMLNGANMEGVVSNLPRAVNLLQLAPQSAEVASSYGMYQTKMAESKAVTALAMNGSVADLLHSFIEQLQKDSNLDRDIMIKEQTQEAQSTSLMAGHLHDGDNAAIQILISAAG